MFKFLKRLLGNDGWHKLSDKLPPENEKVVVYGYKRHRSFPETCIGIMHTLMSGEHELWIRDSSCKDGINFISESHFNAWYWKRIGKPEE